MSTPDPHCLDSSIEIEPRVLLKGRSQSLSSKAGTALDLPEFIQTIIKKLEFSTNETDISINVYKSRDKTADDILAPGTKLETISVSDFIVYTTLKTFSDSSLQKKVLISITDYCSAQSYLVGLMCRFLTACGTDMAAIRQKVITTLTVWAKLCPYLFDDKMLSALEDFGAVVSIHGSEMQSKYVSSAVNYLRRTFDAPPPPPPPAPGEDVAVTGPGKLKSMMKKLGPAETAKQLTIRHSALFMAVRPRDLLAGVYGTGKPESIDALTQHFELLTTFVSFSTIYFPNAAERAEMYGLWAAVAFEFRRLNDFLGLFSVVHGLKHRSVCRLSKTMALVGKQMKKQQAAFDELVELCRLEGDFKSYRETIARVRPPLVPFIGCFQKDWIYFQETLPKPKDGSILVPRCDRAAALFDQVASMQNHQFDFVENPKFMGIFAGILKSPNTVMLMQISLSWEPN